MQNMLISPRASAGISCVLVLLSSTVPAQARRKACMTDHFHYGASAGEPTKRAAEAAAIQSWADFTDFEYGSAWSRYKNARSKAMKCEQSGTSWGCKVEAVPCR